MSKSSMENKYVCCEQKKVIIVGNRATTQKMTLDPGMSMYNRSILA